MTTENHLQIYKRNLVAVIALLVVGGVAALYWGTADPRYAAGLALGGMTGMVKLWLQIARIARLAAGQASAADHAKGNLQGYLLMAGALLLALAMRERFEVWATFAGLFLPNLVLIADGVLRRDPFHCGDADRCESAGAGNAEGGARAD